MSLRRFVGLALFTAPLALAAALVPLFTTGAGAAEPSSRRPGRPAQNVIDAKPIFLRDCAICHGNDARGTPNGPDLRGFGQASIDYELSTGRMPLPSPDAKVVRRAPRYPPDVRDALVTYVFDLAGGGGPDIPVVDLHHADLAQGGELFRLNCAACHAWAGRGGALLAREAPSTHPATPIQTAEAIRVGPGMMPAFGQAALSQKQLADVVAYVQYIRHPENRGGYRLWFIGPLAEGGVAWIVGLGLLLVVVRWIGTGR
ncbi:MAG: c-type cytochrome [Actinobacteria bacterium]|nr:c-type cytochrome [Actinomycetota bacterium]